MSVESPKTQVLFSFGSHGPDSVPNLASLAKTLQSFYLPNGKNTYFREEANMPPSVNQRMVGNAFEPSYLKTYLYAVTSFMTGKSVPDQADVDEVYTRELGKPENIFLFHEIGMIDDLKKRFQLHVQAESSLTDKQSLKSETQFKHLSKIRNQGLALAKAGKVDAALLYEKQAIVTMAANSSNRNKSIRYALSNAIKSDLATNNDSRIAIRLGTAHDNLFDQITAATRKHGDRVGISRTYDGGVTDPSQIYLPFDELTRTIEINPSFKLTSLDTLRSLTGVLVDLHYRSVRPDLTLLQRRTLVKSALLAGGEVELKSLIIATL